MTSKQQKLDGPMRRIHFAVREYFGYEFRFKSAEPKFVVPRHIAMYLSYRMIFGASYPGIGKYYGGFEHTCVLRAVKQVGEQSQRDEKLRAVVGEIRAKIKADGPLTRNEVNNRATVIDAALAKNTRESRVA